MTAPGPRGLDRGLRQRHRDGPRAAQPGGGVSRPRPLGLGDVAAVRNALRRTYRAHHVAVLEMAHDTPGRLGRVGNPGRPARLGGPLERDRCTLAAGLGAVEVWNEPDISFGGYLPSDQYVPLAKAMAYGFETAKVDVPLVGGVVADCKPPWLDTASGSLLLDRVDVFSFHTYGSAMQMEPLVGKFRPGSVRTSTGPCPCGSPSAGTPGTRGSDRPTTAQDARSAVSTSP